MAKAAKKPEKSQTSKAQQSPQETIEGVVTRRRFHKPEDGWCVLAVSVKGHIDDITATGNLLSVREGDTYKFTGSWTTHPTYGKQFKFAGAELILPTGKAGVARYLSGVTYGVGLVKATKIVDELGEDALEQIKKDPAVLKKLEFLNDDQRMEIAEDLTQNSVQAELAGMICKQGIGMGTVNRIFQCYGQDSIRKVKENPYLLADDLWGVGFKKADAIAMTVGIESNSPFRVEAAVNYALETSGQEGHVYLQPNDVVKKLIGRNGLVAGSGVDVGLIRDANYKLINDGKCIREGDALYSTALYEAEKGVAARIAHLLHRHNEQFIEGLNTMIDDTELKFGVGYAPEQRKAIMAALQSGFSIITGGPGTGKTTVINAICSIYQTLNPFNELYLCAPTGRAAKRMSEATNRQAQTIHRLLRYSPAEGGFTYGYGNPLPGPGLLIVDESSMMDIELAHDLLAAVNNLQVIFVGDVQQLPSVGPGSVLRDCIECGKVPTVRLEFNFRQAGGSKIAEYANMVCKGIVPPLMTEGDFEFIEVEDADQAVSVIKALVDSIVGTGTELLNWQILAPMKRGSCGVKALNDMAREIANPPNETKPMLLDYALMDKVMVIKNNYRLGVFNGDLGIVTDVTKNTVTVDFGDGEVEFPYEDLNILTLAYASTIHKSQGSEFDIVIMPLVSQHYMMLQRNLLYTGMTRAKKRLILVADRWSVKKAVSNNVIEERYSLLADRIKKGFEAGITSNEDPLEETL